MRRRFAKISFDTSQTLSYNHVMARFNLTIPDQQRKALQKLSVRSGVRVTDLVRRAIERLLSTPYLPLEPQRKGAKS